MKAKKHSGRGGARKGAGRKITGSGKRRQINVRVAPETIELLAAQPNKGRTIDEAVALLHASRKK